MLGKEDPMRFITAKTISDWSFALFATLSLCLIINSARAQEQVTALDPLSAGELESLVGPIALYPDDLLGIVLDASAHPLQIVQAERFLEASKNNPNLTPDENWDESVVALLNYPEILEFLNEDLEWTESLGFAFLDQQAELFAAVQNFRKQAYSAGNLKSDDYQEVVIEDFNIKIKPAQPDVIYIPSYEPAQVVVYQPYPVYGYYPYAYPVYYYPYPSHHRFASGFFWGVTTVFLIDWIHNGFYSHHYSHHSHPYYGHNYYRGNHYYHSGGHYANHGRHHVKHKQRHARRHDRRDNFRDARAPQRSTKHDRFSNKNSRKAKATDTPSRNRPALTNKQQRLETDARNKRGVRNQQNKNTDTKQFSSRAKNENGNGDTATRSSRQTRWKNPDSADRRAAMNKETRQRVTKRSGSRSGQFDWQAQQRAKRETVASSNKRSLTRTSPRADKTRKTVTENNATSSRRNGNSQRRVTKRTSKNDTQANRTRNVQQRTAPSSTRRAKPQSQQRTQIAQRSSSKQSDRSYSQPRSQSRPQAQPKTRSSKTPSSKARPSKSTSRSGSKSFKSSRGSSSGRSVKRGR